MPEERDESVEELLASIDAEFLHGASDHIWMQPGMTIAQLQDRLDSLGMRRVALRACGIGLQKSRDLFFIVTVEGQQVFEDGDPEFSWTTAKAAKHEAEGAMPAVTARYDDQGLASGFVDFVLDAPELRERGLLVTDDNQAHNLGIYVPEVDVVVPLTEKSVITWRSRFDGSDNELIVRDGVAYREMMARFGDYYSSRPLDPARVEADIARIHETMTRLSAGERVTEGEWNGPQADS